MSKLQDTAYCPICGVDTVTFHKKVEQYSIFRCDSCRLLWVPEVTENEVENFYNKHYYCSGDVTKGYPDYLDEERPIRDLFRTIEKRVNCFGGMPDKSFLDIGCAYGFSLDEARSIGYRVMGVEPSLHCVDYARNVLKLPVYHGTIEGISPKEKFGLIGILGTIEHLLYPKREFLRARKLLKAGGYLAITTLDTDSAMGMYHLKPPEHLYYFNRANLTLLFEQCGYEVCLSEPMCRYYYIDDIIQKMANRFIPALLGLTKILGKTNLLRVMVKIPTNECLIIARKTRESKSIT